MKVALCFIINYEHLVHKEKIWREWIESNKDIINVYFYYNDIKKIRSKWILHHTIPSNYIHPTSYFHVIPAYLSVIKFAYEHDEQNQWFCLLTDSCCPIISPKRFRYLFFNHYNKTIMNWRKAWWNIEFHKRANLHKLPEDMRLANDPWFVLKRENVYQYFQFMEKQPLLIQTISRGGLANESLFAIMLYCCNELEKAIRSITHITDWTRPGTATSPHMFREGNQIDIQFIERNLLENEYAMFLRKVHPEFPDEILKKYIYDFSKQRDALLILNDPFLQRKKYFFIVDIFTNFIYLLPFIISIWLFFTKELI
jgi:hypothetical protein